MTTGRILVVDDDPSLRRVLQVQLEQEGYEVVVTASAQQTLSLLQLQHFDLVITDLRMPGMSGLALLKHARLQYPQTIVIKLTAFGTVETAVEAMKPGACDYLTKPVHADEMSVVMRRALEHLRLVEQVRTLRLNLNKKYGFENILGRSTDCWRFWTRLRGPRAAILPCSSAGKPVQEKNCWREPFTSIVPAATIRWSRSTAERFLLAPV